MKNDCQEPKVELKNRKCFICGAPGCLAKTCPKKGQAAKALTSPGADAPAWFGCVVESCVEPAHRSKHQRRMTAWAKATAAADRAPQGFTLGDAMGSVFTRLAALDAQEQGGVALEEHGQDDQASVVPLVSTLKMAAAETPLESADKRN